MGSLGTVEVTTATSSGKGVGPSWVTLKLLLKIVDAALVRRLLFVVDVMLALAHHQHAINLSLGVEGLELLFDGLAGVEEACFGFADGSDAGSLLSRHGVLCLLSF